MHQRTDFEKRLRENLATRNIKLVHAELGRKDGDALWVLTLEYSAAHIVSLRIIVDALDPFDLKVADAVTKRVFQYLLAGLSALVPVLAMGL